jgi:hypothetical protein
MVSMAAFPFNGSFFTSAVLHEQAWFNFKVLDPGFIDFGDNIVYTPSLSQQLDKIWRGIM